MILLFLLNNKKHFHNHDHHHHQHQSDINDKNGLSHKKQWLSNDFIDFDDIFFSFLFQKKKQKISFDDKQSHILCWWRKKNYLQIFKWKIDEQRNKSEWENNRYDTFFSGQVFCCCCWCFFYFICTHKFNPNIIKYMCYMFTELIM